MVDVTQLRIDSRESQQVQGVIVVVDVTQLRIDSRESQQVQGVIVVVDVRIDSRVPQ